MKNEGKILLVFGAGASKDAGVCEVDIPPLGNTLLDELQTSYPETWGMIDEKYFRGIDRFEEGLENYLREHDERIFPLIKDLARYFSKFYIKYGNNKYIQFVEHFKKEIVEGKFFFYSINYEILFDLALVYNNIDFNYNPYDYSDITKLIKIHGSCNFITTLKMQVKGNITMPHSIDEDGHIKFGVINGIWEVVPNPEIDELLKDKHKFPMMALYTKTKNTLFNKDQMLKMRERYNEDVNQSSSIIFTHFQHLVFIE
jgi:hypothetical protein